MTTGGQEYQAPPDNVLTSMVIPDCGGIVLCGGNSTRMRRDKFSLPWGNETLLQHILRELMKVVRPVCVVKSTGQILPPLPSEVLIGEDQDPNRGPIAGLQAGLKLLRPFVSTAFCAACDSPFLNAEVIQYIRKRQQAAQVSAPFDGKYWYPLCASYQTDLEERIRLMNSALRSPSQLIESVRNQPISLEELRSIDPELKSLWNLNSPEEYERAKAESNATS